MVLALAAADNLLVHQMDVTTAFLIPKIEEEIYMNLPQGWQFQAGGDVVARLHKVWVDDLIIAGTSLATINSFKQAIARRFKMKDMGEIHYCLGMQIHVRPGLAELKQTRYIKELLSRHRMSDCRPASTPLEPHTELSNIADGQPLDAGDTTRYRQITGGLLYLVTCTRPDLSVAVNQRRFMSKPTTVHLTAAMHVLRYLRGTTDLGLCYRTPDRQYHNLLVGSSDATWNSITTTSHSVTGYSFLLNSAAISWRTRVQMLVTLSSTESEHCALRDATCEALYLRGLLGETGNIQTQPTMIYQDNQSCIKLVQNAISSTRNKHFVMRINFVRQHICLGDVDVSYWQTGDMPSDVLTKILPRVMHNKFVSILHGTHVG